MTEMSYDDLKEKYEALVQMKTTEQAYLDLAMECKERIEEKNREISYYQRLSSFYLRNLNQIVAIESDLVIELKAENKRLKRDRNEFFDEWKHATKKLKLFENSNTNIGGKTYVTAKEYKDIPLDQRDSYEIED
jgi:uncharacterized protein with von Willebrand factor type A (vWA) domain